ncbi:MAG: ABC transporter ATP-binding protein [Chloroflexota bacterium]|nr:ABC transporter ATP-binding protein [Chloroflexota bacterium]
MKAVIKVDKLRKSYGDVKAVDGISFRVYQSEVFGLLGPNGAGKTTTMEIAEGIRKADSGRVIVLGMNAKQHSRQIKAKIGVQLQTTALYPRLTVREVLALFASFFPKSVPPDKLIKLVGLEDSRGKRCAKLSGGGQQQRLSVALALVNNPQILFLDEPTSGLDPQARHNIWSVIEFVRGKGKTVFLTTHYMEETERLCDRVAIIDKGKIIACDKPDRLVSQHFQEDAIEFDVSRHVDDRFFEHVPGVTNSIRENGKIVVYSDSVFTTVPTLLELTKNSGIELTNLFVRRATLEDVFLKLTGRRMRD